jgi:polysaccharide deacetylase family protein (PEP-CTERM system associated)
MTVDEQSSIDGAFTVDVEDYFQVSAFASSVRADDWDHYTCRVERSTQRLLDLAAETATRGTFFILGWVAERYPDLIRTIHAAGHEIGCHSHRHQLVYDLGPERFRQDLVQSRDVLQSIIGEPVRLYRAPSFSVTRKSLWALEILVEEGFRIDSSVYPVRHDRYGIPGAPAVPHRIRTPAGEIQEVPGTVWQTGRLSVPVGGGGYLRLLPWSVTNALLRSIRQQQRPLNVYVHPWEVDPDQPRIAGSLKSRFRHYQNLRTTLPKLRHLLTSFQLTTMSDMLAGMTLPVAPTIGDAPILASDQPQTVGDM